MITTEQADPTSASIASLQETAFREPFGMLVGGIIVESDDAATFVAHCPSTEAEIARVPLAGADMVRRVVRTAHVAAKGWGRVPLEERIAAVVRMADIVDAHALQLAYLDAVNGGIVLREAQKDAAIASTWIRYMAGAAAEVTGRTLPFSGRGWLLTKREPIGVVARIGAFNHPLLFTAGKIAAPLLMGNSVIVKTPEQAPLSSLFLGRLLKDVFPPGVLQILSGDGQITGDALVGDPLVKRIGLIGSVATGMQIQRRAAESSVKHVTLELGGKNAMIVFPDADLELAVAAAMSGTAMVQSAGQSCGSVTRLFLHEHIYDQFEEELAGIMGTIHVGDAVDPNTQMGPLISRSQLDRVKANIDGAISQGAKLLTGGKRPPNLERGYFIEPTMFGNVTMNMSLARTEVFGPVLSLFRWSDRDTMMAEVNSLDLGLTGAIWTRDLKTAIDCADELDAGYVLINGAGRHFLGAPFGGHKNSGIDVEESIDELYSYTQNKTISLVPA